MSVGLGKISKFFIPYLIGEVEDLGIQPILACSVIYLAVCLVPLPFIRNKT